LSDVLADLLADLPFDLEILTVQQSRATRANPDQGTGVRL